MCQCIEMAPFQWPPNQDVLYWRRAHRLGAHRASKLISIAGSCCRCTTSCWGTARRRQTQVLHPQQRQSRRPRPQQRPQKGRLQRLRLAPGGAPSQRPSLLMLSRLPPPVWLHPPRLQTSRRRRLSPAQPRLPLPLGPDQRKNPAGVTSFPEPASPSDQSAMILAGAAPRASRSLATSSASLSELPFCHGSDLIPG